MSSTGQEVEVTAEDDQVFLTKMQAQLNQNISSASNQPPSFRPSPTVQKTTDRKSFVTNTTSTPVGVSFLFCFVEIYINYFRLLFL